MESSGPFRVVVADEIAEEGLAILREFADVDIATGLAPRELASRLASAQALVVRSQTQVDDALLKAAPRLRIVARAGVGVDNIDVEAATRRGVIVVNAPGGNTIAAAEHTLAMLLAMSRNIPFAMESLRGGEWERERFVGVEVFHKTLGLLGFGRIGREVARRALALGLRILVTDAYVSPDAVEALGAEPASLDDLLRQSDYISIHAPLTPETAGLINAAAFAKMKDGVRIVNCARGGILLEADLLEALNSGKVAGAALDVWEQEPPAADHPLLRHPRVVATPHLGAATAEAQIAVARDVATQVRAVAEHAPPSNAVNLPAISPDEYDRLAPFMALGERIGKLLAALAEGAIEEVNIAYSGDVLELDVRPVSRAVLKGLLQPRLDQHVNAVNAPLIAQERGMLVTESKIAGVDDYLSYLRVEAKGRAGSRLIGGTVLGRGELRIRSIDQFAIDLEPSGSMLLVQHRDRPGVIGLVGTMLGDEKINIAGMHVGRAAEGEEAVMVLTVDEQIPDRLIAEIAAAIDARTARFVEL